VPIEERILRPRRGPPVRPRRAFVFFLTATLLAFLAWRVQGHDAPAGEHTATEAPRPAVSFDHDHSSFTVMLRRYVQDGRVDYAAWKGGGEVELHFYLATLESVRRGDYERWTREQKLAFWINAYNGNTIRLILAHFPVRSIRSIGNLPLAAFRDHFIWMPEFQKGRMSLDQIEHKILRKQFGEPRVHFAIVCAAKGCPVLQSEAYRAAALNNQLEEATRQFIRDPARNRFDAESRTLYLSSIFKWFRGDFEQTGGTRTAFVVRYAEEPTAVAIRTGSVRVVFLPYDWSLNGTAPDR
jgi:hypothetical protein